ncbi:MAG: hypothetical protein ACLF0G_02880 [Candidatus Brocadiia bacterium]
MVRRAFALCLLLIGAACAGAEGPLIDRRDEIARRLEGRWRRIQKVRPRMGCRELFGFALEAAGSNSHLARIERVLELAEQMQDREPESRTYGNFKWYWEAEGPVDRNAVEFCMQQGILVWMLYRDRLTPGAAERLERLIRFAVEGIRRHHVRESYTNIFLMKTWNCVAIGEATGRPELAKLGRQMLDRWLIYTWERGIHEYLSPTYYGVDLDSLGLLARFARHERTRRDAETALRLFWTDIAANWFPPAQRLGGAHSRDYDYLTGRGYLNLYMRRLGWVDDQSVRASAFDQLTFWEPPQDILALVEEVPRLVHQRWGGDKGERAVHFVGEHAGIGSAGANYGPMDKVLTVNFAGGWRVPQLYFFMDARGDPYGKKRFAYSRSGHTKALHIQPFVASVQEGRRVLLLAHADPAARMFRRRAPQPTCLLSHIVFPAKAQTWIGDRHVTVAKGQKAEVPPGAPVLLRLGQAAVVIQVALATDTAGGRAPVAIANDGQHDAMRLTITHAASPPTATAAVAVQVHALTPVEDGDMAALLPLYGPKGAWPVRVAGPDDGVLELAAPSPLPQGRRLRLRVDLDGRRRLAIEGDEPRAEDRLLAVNGRDYGRELLRDVPVVARYREVLEAARTGAEGAAKAGEVLQAEDAAFVVAPFQVDEGEGAAGGKFLWMPGKVGEAGPGSRVARAVWLVNVPRAGDYALWGRVLAPTPSDDSFFVRVGQDGCDALPRTAWHTALHASWEWARVTAEETRKPATVPLRAGAAAIEFACREDGTKLDALFLAPQGVRPPE